ncbi:MAG: patatin-like phospholipase family protein [Blastococcus sp.]
MTAPMQDLLATDATDATDDRRREGTALCLSGGGYRAMVFHAGVLQRLNELGYLKRLDFVSSVSGGSITAGVLALAWRDLEFDAEGRATDFEKRVVEPVREMAARGIDVMSVLTGLLLPGRRISDRVQAAYREHLFGDATLQDLPHHPRFVFCATNLQTASLFRFSRRYVADYRLGVARDRDIPLATAVAASSAFPPYLSPVTLRMPADAWDPQVPQKLAEGVRDPIVLTDGGVYDNLGLEPVIKRCSELLVSNGGGQVSHPGRIPTDWLRHLQRVLGVVDNQVRSLRKRMLVEGYRRGDYTGAYWGIRSAVSDFDLPDPLPFPETRARELAAVPTRLAALGDVTDDLLRWGYVICDTAMRRWVVDRAAVPQGQ